MGATIVSRAAFALCAVTAVGIPFFLYTISLSKKSASLVLRGLPNRFLRNILNLLTQALAFGTNPFSSLPLTSSPILTTACSLLSNAFIDCSISLLASGVPTASKTLKT